MKLILYLILLLTAVLAGVWLQQATGIVTLSFDDFIVEMPMWLTITVGLAIILTILFCSKMINELFTGCSKSRNYFQTSKRKRSRKYTAQALLQLAQSQWTLAEKNAIKGVALSDLPFLNYVSAAKAAQEQQAWDRRDRYLTLAVDKVPDSKLTTGIIKAKLQYKQGDFAQSLVTLQYLQDIHPKHPVVLRSLAEVYVKIKDWDNLFKLLPHLKKYSNCSKYALDELSEQAYQGLLLEKMQQSGKQELIKFWKEIPNGLRVSAVIVETYGSCLFNLNAHVEAAELLRNVLKKIWDKRLIRMYGFIQVPNLNRYIYIAEEWFKEHPGDPALLLTLARLCLRNQLWGKARDYLEMSVQLEPNPETYAELGRLLDYLGETERSQDCYRKGLLTVTEIISIDK